MAGQCHMTGDCIRWEVLVVNKMRQSAWGQFPLVGCFE